MGAMRRGHCLGMQHRDPVCHQCHGRPRRSPHHLGRVEIDGVFRSQDGGETWAHVEHGLYDPDIHAMALAPTSSKRVWASTARDLFTSVDMGETWESLDIKANWPLPYARGIAVKADNPEVLFAGCGATTTGENGYILRTTDDGITWEILKLPVQPNATIWGFATHPANADRILAFSLFGEVYVTEDGGESWQQDRARIR